MKKTSKPKDKGLEDFKAFKLCKIKLSSSSNKTNCLKSKLKENLKSSNSSQMRSYSIYLRRIILFILLRIRSVIAVRKLGLLKRIILTVIFVLWFIVRIANTSRRSFQEVKLLGLSVGFVIESSMSEN